MTLPASVIVVSRDRPAALVRCLTGINQLCHPNFEVVAVADAPGFQAVQAAGFAERIKLVACDKPNISIARNLGIAAAAGDLLAFIDDDAVPEPTWLTHLSSVFRDADVAAAGGYVRGRNGIGFQNRGRRVDRLANHSAVQPEGDTPALLQASLGQAVKTEGTNCAFRAGILRTMGGFDPSYAFYLDETDVNLRLAAHSAVTAIVPLAEVHHGFAASPRRYASRMPRTLYDIGFSQAVFLRKHAPDHLETRLAQLRDEQRVRLLRFMVDGRGEPQDVGRMMRSLEAGIKAGRAHEMISLRPITAAPPPFLKFVPTLNYRGLEVLACRPWQSGSTRAKAAALVAAGRRTTVYILGPTARPHRVRFTSDGVWEQIGGLFGRSERIGAHLRWNRFQERVTHEAARVARVRDCE